MILNFSSHKLAIINDILYYKETENYYSFWNDDFKYKFNRIIALSSQSRMRLNTKIEDLKKFKQEVLEKVTLNKYPCKKNSY